MVILPKGSNLREVSTKGMFSRSALGGETRSDPQSIHRSILQTLKYSDHFGFPLTAQEIHLRLVEVMSSRSLISRTLEHMIQQNLVQKNGIYYYLPGEKSLISKRLINQKLSKLGTIKARIIASKLGGIHGVLAVYLTGSLAVNNSGDSADIDLMIITRNKRLWTTRLCLTAYTELLGLRRRPHSKYSSGKVCLNLYLSPESYTIPLNKRSLYTAYELIQAVPLYDPHNTHPDLLSANPWIHSYLPNYSLSKGRLLDRRPEQARDRDAEGGRSILVGIPGIIESLCYHLQLFYMRSKLTREYITPNSAFFHPNDPAPRGLSLKGIPDCKSRRARRQPKGQSSKE